jgi:hypothetical protein
MQDRSGTMAGARLLFRSCWLIWATGGALIVFTLLACALAMWNLHRLAIDQQRVTLRNLSFVLAEQTTRYVQLVDVVLQEVQSRAVELELSTTGDIARTFGTSAMRTLLLDRLKNLPQANAYVLLRSDGHILVTTRPNVPAGLDFSDRDYFRHFAERDETSTFVGGLTISRVLGTPTLYISRRINGVGRSFLGVAVGAIDLDYLTNFYRAIGCSAAMV